MLQSRLLGDGDQWTKAVMTWSRLQGELADRRTAVNAPSTARGVSRKREEEEKCDVESRKSTEGQREESGKGRLRSGEHNGAQTLEKKRKRDDDEEEEEEEEEEERRGAARDSSSEKNIEKTDLNGRDHATSGLDHNVESSSRRMDDMAKDFIVESLENGNKTDHFFSFVSTFIT